MTILSICLAPDPVLRQRAQPVDKITDDIRALLDDMAETMYDAPGIGLAANQVGQLVRVIVMDCADDGDPPQLFKMINPEILDRSTEMNNHEEGCLSIPGYNGEVSRSKTIRVSYLTPDGKKHVLDADGLLATCIQHEIDHLNGILFIDHLSHLKRNMIWRKLLKDAKSRS